jgi:hypothetical protein
MIESIDQEIFHRHLSKRRMAADEDLDGSL